MPSDEPALCAADRDCDWGAMAIGMRSLHGCRLPQCCGVVWCGVVQRQRLDGPAKISSTPTADIDWLVGRTTDPRARGDEWCRCYNVLCCVGRDGGSTRVGER